MVDPTVLATDEFGSKTFKAVYHDSKLSTNTPWTANQRTEIIDKFKNNYPDVKTDNLGSYLEFEVKSSSTYFKDYDELLETGDKIRIYKTDVYKSISNGDGKLITQTIKFF